ncbi:unnamed protein product [Arabidopsis thaliana]|uniref:(thale cress) hypothetical protein n=1 Tax=Arabidopsis thaliana TaxID=3702 RepID=A0A7G2FB61_ARATH|nr:unnamed protein product [Arabidopsis thaliana]
MSGKGFEEDNQTLEILRLALGWTKSEIYVLTMHWLIVGVEMYLFWPLYPNFPHVWGDSVMGMVMIQYVTGVISYASMSHPLTALLGRVSHLSGNVAIAMLLVHTVSHHVVLWIAIPSCLWLGSVFLFTLVDSFCIINSSPPEQYQLLC